VEKEWVVEEVAMEEEWVVEEAEVVEAETRMEAKASRLAYACWVVTNGTDANRTITAAIATILKAIPLFECINTCYY
jgi:hypothetical protein